MHCPLQDRSQPEILLDYCARRLSSEALVRFEAHLEHCEECRRFAEGQQLLWSTLDAWKPERVGCDFDDRLYERLEPRRPAFSWRPALPVAAVCATAALVLLWNLSARSVRAFDAEQVEQAIEDVDMLRQFTGEPAA